MVERINQPETPPAYRILPSKDVKDDQSRRQEQETSEENYQKMKAKGDWEKYRGRNVTIKPVRAARERIDRVLFKNVILYGGKGILEATLVWKDGRTTDPALFSLERMEDYLRLKTFQKGAIVPENFWAKGRQEIEIGIVQAEPASGSWRAADIGGPPKTKPAASPEKKLPWLVKLGLFNQKTLLFQWHILAAYILGFFMLVLLIFYAVK